MKTEAPHIHFSKHKSKYIYGKLWLQNLEIMHPADFSAKELNIVKKLATKYQKELIDLYNSFGKKETHPIKLTLK
ncbi:MAG: DUF4160 domain-containing protein [Bacteroidetes bacterium]|nr:DUF4160 domain-containing protein [Bacteroidota bacterium]